MKLLLIVAGLVAPIVVECATTVTFYRVQVAANFTDYPVDSPIPSETINAGGLGPDGLATLSVGYVYIGEFVATHVIPQVTSGVTNGFSTVYSTTTFPPETLRGTLVADASHYEYTYTFGETDSRGANFFDEASCTLDGLGGGGCIERAGYGTAAPLRLSWTGTAIPYRTEVFSNGQNTKSEYSRMPAIPAIIAWSAVLLGTMFGFLMIL